MLCVTGWNAFKEQNVSTSMLSILLIAAAAIITWKSVSYAFEGLASLNESRNLPKTFLDGIVLALPLSATAALAFRAGVPTMMLPMLCGFSLGALVLATGLSGLMGKETLATCNNWLLLTCALPLLSVLVDTGKLEAFIPLMAGLAFLQQADGEGRKLVQKTASYGEWQAVAVVLLTLLGTIIGANILVEQTAAASAEFNLKINFVAMAVGAVVSLAVLGDWLEEAVLSEKSSVTQHAIDAVVVSDALALGIIAIAAPVGISAFNVSAAFAVMASGIIFELASKERVTRQFGFGLLVIFPLILLAVDNVAAVIGGIL